MGFVPPKDSSVPEWIKSNAKWWAEDILSDSDFLLGIQYMIEEKIISISIPSTHGNSESVPDWVKNTADWWADDLISEQEFVDSLKFLIKEGILVIS